MGLFVSGDFFPMKNGKIAISVYGLAVMFATMSASESKQYYGSTSKSVNVKSSKTKTDSSIQTKLKSTELWKSGVKLLADKNWSGAAERFEFMDAHGGCCDETHYYLAQCYQGQNQTVLAQMHYQWVASNSKNARLRQYAGIANEQLAYYQAHRTYSGQGAVPVAYSFG